MMSEEIYEKLKALPQPENLDSKWPDYASLNLGEDAIDDLLDLTSDYYLSMEQSDEESAISIHAWRSLAVMKNLELMPEFIILACECDVIDDDWFAHDFPKVMSYLGMPALPALLQGIEDNPSVDIFVERLGKALLEMVESDEDRSQALKALSDLFGKAYLDRDLYAFVVSGLIDLKGKEKIDLIREQFAANRVNVSLVGDLEEVELQLGLREARDTPKPNFPELEMELEIKDRKSRAGTFPKEGSLEEKLQYFLVRYEKPSSIKAVDALDGLLLSICSSGASFEDKNLQKVSNLVWGSASPEDDLLPEFANKEEEKAWLSCLRDFARRIEKGLQNKEYQPHLSVWPNAEDSMDPEAPYFSPWLDGFLAGETFAMGLNEKEFDPNDGRSLGFLAIEMIEQEEAGIRLLEDNENNPIFEFMELVQSKFQESVGFDFLGDAAFDTDDFVTEPPVQAAKKEKIERNAPCPCGSGLKYKRCCMN